MTTDHLGSGPSRLEQRGGPRYGGIDEPYDFPGIPFGDGSPGDRFAQDADLTVYWPWVRPCWEER